MYTNYFKIT